ncbi:MAG: ester cyclase, partial [Pseudomonadota bacterium]
MDIHARNKAALTPFRQALYDFDKSRARDVAAELFAPAAPVYLSHPFNSLTGQSALLEAAILPLAQCFPDLERRDQIIVAGESQPGQNWVGCAGHYLGTFRKPWMKIPATGHIASIRFHELYRFGDDGRVAEVQALWDIPDLMMQVGVWPMVKSLGREWTVPSPANGEGLNVSGDGGAALGIVTDMLNHLGNHAKGGVAAMRLEAFWHSRFNWYGPAGIGTGRGIEGFRRWHQIPFLNAMPDREGDPAKGHLFSEGNFVGFTAWPGMRMTLSGDGWLGLPAA